MGYLSFKIHSFFSCQQYDHHLLHDWSLLNHYHILQRYPGTHTEVIL